MMEKRGVLDNENEEPAKEASDKNPPAKPTCCGGKCAGEDLVSKIAQELDAMERDKKGKKS